MFEEIFEKHINKILPFTMKPHIISANIDLQKVASVDVPSCSPCLLPKPTFIFGLHKHKKSETNHLFIQQHFSEIKA